ncbi:MAG: hypothetical protein BHV78_05440 [Bacteroides sp. CAG:1060_57_27]|nr:MAG: hypothetical protein BHV78_05440 [Bacteroides sp. CAG:1060_57_27]
MKKLTKLFYSFAASVFLSVPTGFAQGTAAVSGTVSDTQGLPVIGAGVMLSSDSTVGTTTDLDGNYSISVPPDASLTFSCIGYKTVTVDIAGRAKVDVVMEEDSEFLEETVVIGYGVQRKSDVTGAIASVKDSDIANRSAISVAQALQGKAAGVQIVNPSGAPGATSSIQIRGYSSNSKTTPLMIVDGLKVSDINYLDPESIASIEVLKDAASAAIYGIEAGNGVILITTKSGSNSQGRVFYNFQNSIQSVAKMPDLMNAREWMDYMLLSGANQDMSEFDYDGVTDTYWPGLMFEKGYIRRHTVGASAGNDRGNLYVSLSYTDNNGIIAGDKDVFNRLTGQINAEYKINNWLTIGTNNSLSRTKSSSVSESSGANTSLLGAILTYDPITPWTYTDETLPDRVRLWLDQGHQLPTDANGNIYGTSIFSGNSLIWHPAIMRDRTDSSSDSFYLMGTTYANFTPIKGLTITSRFGYSAGFRNTHTYNYELYINSVANQNMSINGRSQNSLFYQWENFANYNTTIKKHSISAMVGMSFQKSMSDYVYGTANLLADDDPNFRYLEYTENSTSMGLGGVPSTSANMSYFGRIGYSYDDRYFFQANFRADAYDTSKLDASNRWGYFPSVSAGWTISNEQFMQDFKSTIGMSFMKFRASWGINGNVNAMGSYQYMDILRSSMEYGYDFGDNVMVAGVAPSGVLPNPDIKWETSHQIDLGVDMRFFNERLAFSLDWYNKNTHDLITSTTAPANTGSTRMYINAGKVNNHGTEIELSWKDNIGDFGYSVSGNLATVHNKVLEGTSADRVQGERIWTSYYMTYFEQGYPLWYLRAFIIDGIDQETGAPIYRDTKPDGVINDDDRDYAGSGIPDFTYGLTLTMNYKNFDLIVYGAGSQGAELLYSLNRGDFAQQNTLREFYYDAWQNPQSTGYKYPKPDYSDTYLMASTARIFDASFFKIKQIQLGYTIPERLLSKIKISSLRAYVSLDDWFTFTKYPGLDPETSHAGTSAAGLGIDYGSYPIPRKLVFGVNVSF